MYGPRRRPIAQGGLRGPTDRLRIVLHVQRGPVGIVHLPEQHGIDIHRHGVGRERLLGGKGGGDDPLSIHVEMLSTNGTNQNNPGPRVPW